MPDEIPWPTPEQEAILDRIADEAASLTNEERTRNAERCREADACAEREPCACG